MKNIELTILIQKDSESGWYVGQIEEFPAAISQAATIDELKFNLSARRSESGLFNSLLAPYHRLLRNHGLKSLRVSLRPNRFSKQPMQIISSCFLTGIVVIHSPSRT